MPRHSSLPFWRVFVSLLLWTTSPSSASPEEGGSPASPEENDPPYDGEENDRYWAENMGDQQGTEMQDDESAGERDGDSPPGEEGDEDWNYDGDKASSGPGGGSYEFDGDVEEGGGKVKEDDFVQHQQEDCVWLDPEYGVVVGQAIEGVEGIHGHGLADAKSVCQNLEQCDGVVCWGNKDPKNDAVQGGENKLDLNKVECSLRMGLERHGAEGSEGAKVDDKWALPEWITGLVLNKADSALLNLWFSVVRDCSGEDRGATGGGAALERQKSQIFDPDEEAKNRGYAVTK